MRRPPSHLGAAVQRDVQEGPTGGSQRDVIDGRAADLVRYRTEGASLIIEWGTERGRPPALAAECAIAALVRLCREVLGPDALRLDEVHFVHPAPADTDAYALRAERLAALVRAVERRDTPTLSPEVDSPS